MNRLVLWREEAVHPLCCRRRGSHESPCMLAANVLHGRVEVQVGEGAPCLACGRGASHPSRKQLGAEQGGHFHLLVRHQGSSEQPSCQTRHRHRALTLCPLQPVYAKKSRQVPSQSSGQVVCGCLSMLHASQRSEHADNAALHNTFQCLTLSGSLVLCTWWRAQRH